MLQQTSEDLERRVQIHTVELEAANKKLRQEITEREQVEKRLHESEKQYRDLFENANDLIQSVGLDGRFVYVNRAWQKTLGYSQEEVSNLSLLDVIPPDNQAYCMDIFQCLTSGEQFSDVEVEFVSKIGEIIEVEGNVNCQFVNGSPIATRAIFRDVTQRNQTAATLSRLGAILEHSFGTLK